MRRSTDRRAPVAPRTPFNGPITPHRKFAYGSLPLDEIKVVKNAYGMTVNDVVMALCTSALRRWLLDHDALPSIPVVVAVPVSIRSQENGSAAGNLVSVMLAEVPTHLGAADERLAFVQESMQEAKQHFDAVPASILQDLSMVIPTALSGLAARALFKLVTLPGPPFNLFVSNVPGPQLALYVAGARVLGVYPVSAVAELSGGLNITCFSYDGALDIGLIACRELVPDVWNSSATCATRSTSSLVWCLPSAGCSSRTRSAARGGGSPRAVRRTTDGLDDRGPDLHRQVVAHPGDQQQLRTGDGGGGGPAPGRMHHSVGEPVDHHAGMSSRPGRRYGRAARGSRGSAAVTPAA